MLYIVAKLLTVQFFVFEVPVCQGVFISSGKFASFNFNFASFNLINLFLLLDNLLVYSLQYIIKKCLLFTSNFAVCTMLSSICTSAHIFVLYFLFFIVHHFSSIRITSAVLPLQVTAILLCSV